MELIFDSNRADIRALNAHLLACDSQFIPLLSERVDLAAYGAKLAAHAQRFEAWSGDRLIGLVAAYANAPERQSIFVTNVSVMPDRHGQGIATRLLSSCIDYARDAGFMRVALKVDARNKRARALYRALNFSDAAIGTTEVEMTLSLKA